MEKRIYEVAAQVREILENTDKKDFPCTTSFNLCRGGFPNGCCGDTAYVLAIVLSNKLNLKEIKYVSSKKSQSWSHAWITYSDLVIDITADQFNEDGYFLEPVIVSDTSRFHREFGENSEELISIDRISLNDEYSSIFCVADIVLGRME